jgi:hypothetical protein
MRSTWEAQQGGHRTVLCLSFWNRVGDYIIPSDVILCAWVSGVLYFMCAYYFEAIHERSWILIMQCRLVVFNCLGDHPYSEHLLLRLYYYRFWTPPRRNYLYDKPIGLQSIILILYREPFFRVSPTPFLFRMFLAFLNTSFLSDPPRISALLTARFCLHLREWEEKHTRGSWLNAQSPTTESNALFTTIMDSIRSLADDFDTRQPSTGQDTAERAFSTY